MDTNQQHMRSTFSHTREKLTEGCIRLAIMQEVKFNNNLHISAREAEHTKKKSFGWTHSNRPQQANRYNPHK